ncbi:hypothetical protein GGF50DRAFT_119545 [Schizophyllum commune]
MKRLRGQRVAQHASHPTVAALTGQTALPTISELARSAPHGPAQTRAVVKALEAGQEVEVEVEVEAEAEAETQEQAEEEEEEVVAPTSATFGAFPAFLRPLADQPPNPDATVIDFATPTLEPFVPTSLDNVPAPTFELREKDPDMARVRAAQGPKMRALVQASGRTIEEQVAEANKWLAQVDSSEARATRMCRSRAAGRWDSYIHMIAPHWPADAAWHASTLLRYAPSFLHFLVYNVKRKDGKPIKARTLVYWFGLFIQCILRYAWQDVNDERTRVGTILLVKHNLFTTLHNQVPALTKAFRLDRTYSPRILYGTQEVIMMIEGLLNSKYRNYHVVLQHAQILILAFYFACRPSTLGPISKQHAKDGFIPTFKDVQVYSLGNFRWRIVFTFNCFKGYFDRPVDNTQVVNLDSVEDAQYALLEGPMYFLIAWYHRGVFDPKYKTFVEFLLSRDAHRPIREEALAWYLFRAVGQGGHYFTKDGRPANSGTMTRTVQSGALRVGLRVTGMYGFRRATGEHIGAMYNKELAIALLNHASAAHQKVYDRHYNRNTSIMPYVAMRLCAIPPSVGPDAARRYRQEQVITSLALDAMVGRLWKEKSAEQASGAANKDSEKAELVAQARTESEQLQAVVKLRIVYETLFAEFKALIPAHKKSHAVDVLSNSVAFANDPENTVYQYHLTPTCDLAQAQKRANELIHDVVAARATYVAKRAAERRRIVNELIARKPRLSHIGTLDERATAQKRLNAVPETQTRLLAEGRVLASKVGSSSAGPPSADLSTDSEAVDDDALLCIDDIDDDCVLREAMDGQVMHHLQRTAGHRNPQAVAGPEEEDSVVPENLPPPAPLPASVDASLVPSLPVALWLMYLRTNDPAERKDTDAIITVNANGKQVFSCPLCPILLAHLSDQQFDVPRRAVTSESNSQGRHNRHIQLHHSDWRQIPLKVFRDRKSGLLQCPGCPHRAPSFSPLSDHMLDDCVNQPYFQMLYDEHTARWDTNNGKRADDEEEEVEEEEKVTTSKRAAPTMEKAESMRQLLASGISLIRENVPSNPDVEEVIASMSSILDDVDEETVDADLRPAIPSFEAVRTLTVPQIQATLAQLQQTMPDHPVTAAMEEAAELLADGFEPLTEEEYWDCYYDYLE